MRTLVLIVAALGVSACRPVRAGEGYYLLIFGSQTQPRILRYTHTWATAVHAVWDDRDPSRCWVEHHTISWLPADQTVEVWDLHPEAGRNFGLIETLDYVLARNERVKLWGPFLLHPVVYGRFVEAVGKLERGVVSYRAISTQLNVAISDCIHAVTALDPVFGRGHYPLIRVGFSASRRIARQVVQRSTEDQRQYDNRWVVSAIGLDRYPIELIPPWEIRHIWRRPMTEEELINDRSRSYLDLPG